ncbi:hypothetical protein BATDEDRAFT_86391 [Batrachochytrium dendrobatidis JAM81]|uniref:Uncharacterized protein n=2 Tax=Batrachochytrium dendrobatidis TaxID=109871 RepID=F4NWT3_BATDJ|nr:uncharacterized protein BATDEDRAFT_86391 [Batrachochytrium dendrobatidis JAM81]EGF82877.1 hypothetical protein BATDEDRAFT_86391 [Batrachochytrium dendrobatidis JAM81]KAJ8327918.1 hypothetical protein O5D80_003307 [Batrachochytrium dendrobatidis]|eukprot:XP_006677081.1 hypothetical protein BATDEDRAFT_86391 [Batrachochytrium dendrobatidis JAM81]
MNRKISKQHISSPTPLMSPMAYHNHQSGKRSTDSGIDVMHAAASASGPSNNAAGGALSGMAARTAERLSFGRSGRTSSYGTPPVVHMPHPIANSTPAIQSRHRQQRQSNLLQSSGRSSPQPANPAALQPMAHAAITPFSAGRFDISASIAGGPLDPRRQKLSDAPPTLNLRQYQSFTQAVAVYRRQIQAMAAATDTFVRALEELSDCVPAAQLSNASVVADLDFFIDSTQLLVNTHQIWASTIEKEIEEPLFGNIETIIAKVKTQQVDNKSRIQGLINELHSEEDKSYKMKKKKQRDLAMLQDSLNVRVSLADEIKRLSIENETLYDTLSHEDMENILNLISRGVVAELETYDTIMEGFHKIGSAAGTKSMTARDSSPSRIQTINSSKITNAPDTEVPAPSSPLDAQLDVDFMKKVFQGLG